MSIRKVCLQLQKVSMPPLLSGQDWLYQRLLLSVLTNNQLVFLPKYFYYKTNKIDYHVYKIDYCIDNSPRLA